MSDIVKKNLKSMNIAEEKRQRLREIFPEVFTEKSIDFDKLKSVLGDIVETGRERYGMNWAGKADCLRIIQEPSVGTLKPCRDESIDFDKTENLFIEGDNLEVLKLLQKSYYGKIKMIYIDPPYNTGNDFIYPDNYSESLDTYLKYTGQVDAEGRKYSTNAETDGRFHTRWINMMYPRLYLARNLLKGDGIIFISINDVEVTNLRKACDNIFGEENFISQFVWKSRQNKDNRNLTGASIDHEYILCYGRRVRGDERKLEQYSNPDNDPRGPWTSGNMVGMLSEDKRPNCHFDLVNEETGINYGKPKLGWRYDRTTMKRLIDENRIIWPREPSGRPRRKVFLSELKSNYTGYSSIVGEGIYTRDGTAELELLFDRKIMEFPKPSSLIKELIIQGSGESDIVLDFFAGSATTSHATLDLNSNDVSKRKFICVQLPEPCSEDSEPFKAGYKTIADIGKERIRRVINKIKEAKQPELGADIDKQDLGFKVFKLDSSNFRLWDGEKHEGEEAIKEQLKLHIDHIDPESQTEDILYELLLKSGFELTTRIEKLDLAGKEVFSIEDGALLICLEEGLTKEAIKAMAKKAPAMAICLDRGFKNNDQLKTNAVQIMKTKEVEFRTV